MVYNIKVRSVYSDFEVCVGSRGFDQWSTKEYNVSPRRRGAHEIRSTPTYLESF